MTQGWPISLAEMRDRFEYFLAMVDEEEFLTHGVEGKPQERGDTNLRTTRAQQVDGRETGRASL